MFQRLLYRFDRIFGLSKANIDISSGFFPLNIFALEVVQPQSLDFSAITASYDTNYESDQWAQRPEYLALIDQVVSDCNPTSVLDIGCGEGVLLRKILSRHKSITRAVGMDISKAAIEAASKQHADEKRLRFECSPVETFDPSTKFDLVLAIGSLEHLTDPDMSLVSRLMNDGGFLVMIVPTCGRYHPNRDKFVRKGFQTEWWFTRERWIENSRAAGLLHVSNAYASILAKMPIKTKRWSLIFQKQT